jgi:uncharacterized protein
MVGMDDVGQVAELWRYPVKGLLGEERSEIVLDRRGVVGDRTFSVTGADGRFGSAKTTRRFRRMPGLLTMRSATTEDGRVVVGFDDGRPGDVADASTAERVSAVVGEPITLAPEGSTPHVDAGPVHLLTTASLAWLQERLPDAVVDARRFRPNLVVRCNGTGRVEEDWVGREVSVGAARLRIEERTIRCVTVALAQEDLGFAPGIPKALEAANDLCLGVYASVLTPGPVAVGDVVRVSA